jgi:hypothetical protein
LRLALWCEAHGLNAEKVRHLAAAVLADPANATARALLGLVDDGGKWRDARAVAERVKADEALSKTLAAYNGRRDRAPNTAEAQWKLALWCEENGLKEEEAAHLAAVVRLDPSRDAAWKRLGCTKQRDGRWATAQQVAADRAAREAQAAAGRKWRPVLASWKAGLAKPSASAEAERGLEGVDDPLAVPAVWQVFATGNAADQSLAVPVLGRLKGATASRALAVLAVRGRSPEVRRAAAETLRRRDPREFLDGLIASFRPPVRYESVAVGASGTGTPGVFRVLDARGVVHETVFTVDESLAHNDRMRDFLAASFSRTDPLQLWQRNLALLPTEDPARVQAVQRALSAPPGGRTSPPSPGNVPPASFSLNNPMQGAAAAAFNEALLARQWIASYQERVGAQNERIATFVSQVERANAAIEADNDRIDEVLHDLTGASEGKSREAWRAWWTDAQGYAYEPPRRTTDEPKVVGVVSDWVHLSCFAAGTPVRSIGGSTPIEAVRVGDRVLTQDPDTGRQSFQPVIAVYHNKPSATLKVTFEGGASVVATGIHRFWKAGSGWVMARDLKPGDPIRTAVGLDRVAQVNGAVEQPVFNLEVARGASFFAGEPGFLAHDNSLVNPVASPFDAVPDLAAAAPPPG